MSVGAGYGFGMTVNLRFDQALVAVKEALKDQGFGTLSEIDVQATLKEKIGETIEPYTILGACNPNLAIKAIVAEPEVGLLLPCNVLVRERNGVVHVSVLDPALMVGITGNQIIEPVALEARQKLEAALQSLGKA